MQPLSILLVDDDEQIRTTVTYALKRMKHAVISVSDAESAIRLLSVQSFDVLLTDMLLGDGDGTDVIKAAHRANGRIRIVAMSGGGAHPTPSFCLNLAEAFGATTALLKPFSYDALAAAVEGSAAPTRATAMEV